MSIEIVRGVPNTASEKSSVMWYAKVVLMKPFPYVASYTFSRVSMYVRVAMSTTTQKTTTCMAHKLKISVKVWTKKLPVSVKGFGQC